MFAAQAGGSVMKHQGQKKAVKYRNRAKLQNFEIENEKYKDQVMIRNNAWKNEVSAAEIQLDNIFKATYDQWNKDDAQMDAILLEHSFATEEAVIAMHKGSYAGTMTGKTAGRLAAKSSVEAGRKISKSLANVILNKKNIESNAEVIRQQANAKQWKAWEAIWRSPVHGHTPRPPQLEAKPPIGPMLLEIAVAGAGAYMSGTALKSLKNMEAQVGKAVQAGQFNQQTAGMFSTVPSRASFNMQSLGISSPSSGLNLAEIDRYSSSSPIEVDWLSQTAD